MTGFRSIYKQGHNVNLNWFQIPTALKSLQDEILK